MKPLAKLLLVPQGNVTILATVKCQENLHLKTLQFLLTLLLGYVLISCTDTQEGIFPLLWLQEQRTKLHLYP